MPPNSLLCTYCTYGRNVPLHSRGIYHFDQAYTLYTFITRLFSTLWNAPSTCPLQQLTVAIMTAVKESHTLRINPRVTYPPQCPRLLSDVNVFGRLHRDTPCVVIFSFSTSSRVISGHYREIIPFRENRTPNNDRRSIHYPLHNHGGKSLRRRDIPPPLNVAWRETPKSPDQLISVHDTVRNVKGQGELRSV